MVFPSSLLGATPVFVCAGVAGWDALLRAEPRLWPKAASDAHALLAALWSTAILVGLADAATAPRLIAASAAYYAADLLAKRSRPDVWVHHGITLLLMLLCVAGGRADIGATSLQIEWSLLALNAFKRGGNSPIRRRVGPPAVVDGDEGLRSNLPHIRSSDEARSYGAASRLAFSRRPALLIDVLLLRYRIGASVCPLLPTDPPKPSGAERRRAAPPW